MKEITITAAEWHTVAEDVKVGRCEVYDGKDRVFAVGSRNDKDGTTYLIHHSPVSEHIVPTNEGWRYATGRDKLTVRWLLSAPDAAPSQVAAISVDDLKLWALANVDNPAVLAAIDRLVAGSYDLQVAADANGWYDGKMEALAEINALTAERDRLQTELTQTRQQLAEAGENVTAARKYIAQLFDAEQRFDTTKQGRFVTETLNLADGELMIIQDMAKGTASPPLQAEPAQPPGEVWGKPSSVRQSDIDTPPAVASGLCVECIERLQGENRQLRTFVRKSRTYFRAHNDDNVCATMGQKAAALLASLSKPTAED